MQAGFEPDALRLAAVLEEAGTDARPRDEQDVVEVARAERRERPGQRGMLGTAPECAARADLRGARDDLRERRIAQERVRHAARLLRIGARQLDRRRRATRF